MGSKRRRAVSQLTTSGRVRPVMVAIILIISGLFFDKWWWQLGAIILAVVFVEASIRYRTLL
jgi:hypothetical protein